MVLEPFLQLKATEMATIRETTTTAAMMRMGFEEGELFLLFLEVAERARKEASKRASTRSYYQSRNRLHHHVGHARRQ